MRLDELLRRLEGVHKISGAYLARCPAHDDRAPSLSVAEGKDGRLLLHCWAGCPTTAVLSALGLSWADLFAPRPARRRR